MIPDDDYEGLSPNFAALCRAADEKQRRQSPDTSIERTRRLLADDVTLERAWAEIHRAHFRGRAAESTVEALMFALRERGIAAVQEPYVRFRLAQLSEAQLIEVGDRLQRLEPHIAQAWSPDEIAELISAWKARHHD